MYKKRKTILLKQAVQSTINHAILRNRGSPILHFNYQDQAKRGNRVISQQIFLQLFIKSTVSLHANHQLLLYLTFLHLHISA